MEWPIAVMVIAGLFMMIFRKSINEMLGRTKKLGKNGLEMDTGQSDKAPSLPVKKADDLIKGIDSHLIREIEDNIKKNLLEGMPDAEKIKALTRISAASYWGYMAANIYRQIFGSQISALEFLNSQGKIPRESLRPFYSAAAAQYPGIYKDKEYSYDQWLGYLHAQTLLLYDANLIEITIRGQEFLQHLIRDNLPKAKAG